jgi:signal transduction histidine kinase
VFAAELFERLRWFVTLRWIAVLALTLAGVFGPRLGLPGAWPALLVVAGLVAVSNLVFTRGLNRELVTEQRYAELRRCAIRQMVTDLSAVVVTVHFTGGCASPVLPFVVFHMAIGTIMVATRIMYLIGAATCLAVLTLFAAQHTGILSPQPLPGVGVEGTGSSCTIAALMTIALIFGVIYLVDSVTSRFKLRSRELFLTTNELASRSVQLERSLAEREELQRQKAHYMRISAHQLRSPLGTIRTTLQVLLEGYVEAGSAEGLKLLAGAQDRVDALIAIVNDLLELTKMREGRSKAPWSRKVSVSQILADLFDAKDTVARGHGVELVPVFISERSVELDWAVPPDLVYAFENLIDNAIKYSKPEGGRVTVSQSVKDDIATIVVEDNGIGIPTEQHEEVFLEFVRARNAKSHAAEGTGLGLSIVREAIRAHGGDVQLESQLGLGTRFIVTLPLHHEPPEVAAALQARNETGRSTTAVAGVQAPTTSARDVIVPSPS